MSVTVIWNSLRYRMWKKSYALSKYSLEGRVNCVTQNIPTRPIWLCMQCILLRLFFSLDLAMYYKKEGQISRSSFWRIINNRVLADLYRHRYFRYRCITTEWKLICFHNECAYRPSLAGFVGVAIVFHTLVLVAIVFRILLLVLPVRISFFVVNQLFFSMQFRKRLYIYILFCLLFRDTGVQKIKLYILLWTLVVLGCIRLRISDYLT
jgi:hypothetical protein